MTTLRTERLTLRRARSTDLDAFHVILSDPETMRYWSTLPHESLDVTRAWLNGMIEADPAVSDDFVVEFEGRAVGKAGFWKRGEVGYILAREVWGRGVASEAVSAVLDYGFTTLGYETVVADVDPRNEGSIRLLERLGFHRTGFAKDAWLIGGIYYDSVYFVLPRADWRVDRNVKR